MTGRVQNGVRKALCVIERDVPRRLNEVEIVESADVTERVPRDVAKVNADDRLAKNGRAEVEHVSVHEARGYSRGAVQRTPVAVPDKVSRQSGNGTLLDRNVGWAAVEDIA